MAGPNDYGGSVDLIICECNPITWTITFASTHIMMISTLPAGWTHLASTGYSLCGDPSTCFQAHSNQHSQTLTSLHLQDPTSSSQMSARVFLPSYPPVTSSWRWSPPNPRHTAAWRFLSTGQGSPLSSSSLLQCCTKQILLALGQRKTPESANPVQYYCAESADLALFGGTEPKVHKGQPLCKEYLVCPEVNHPIDF